MRDRDSEHNAVNQTKCQTLTSTAEMARRWWRRLERRQWKLRMATTL